MRPLELNLTAFRSYASETIDFRPYALVVISGDTGRGQDLAARRDRVCPLRPHPGAVVVA